MQISNNNNNKEFFRILKTKFGEDYFGPPQTGGQPFDDSFDNSTILDEKETKDVKRSFSFQKKQNHEPTNEVLSDVMSQIDNLWKGPGMSQRMKEIESLGKVCFSCGKEFKLFKSELLPHIAGHFFKYLTTDLEKYFTQDDQCFMCPAKLTKRKSKVIHLAVNHERVLPFIEEMLNVDEKAQIKRLNRPRNQQF